MIRWKSRLQNRSEHRHTRSSIFVFKSAQIKRSTWEVEESPNAHPTNFVNIDRVLRWEGNNFGRPLVKIICFKFECVRLLKFKSKPALMTCSQTRRVLMTNESTIIIVNKVIFDD